MRRELDVGSAAARPSGEYEIIALHEGGKHVYTRLDNDRLQEGLHEAMGRYFSREARRTKIAPWRPKRSDNTADCK